MDKLNFIWGMPRLYKRIISMLIDSLFIILSACGAYWARIGNIEPLYTPVARYVIAGTLIVSLLTFIKLGLYRAVLRYLTFQALAVIALVYSLWRLSVI